MDRGSGVMKWARERVSECSIYILICVLYGFRHIKQRNEDGHLPDLLHHWLSFNLYSVESNGRAPSAGNCYLPSFLSTPIERE